MPLIIKPTVLQSASLAGAEAAHHLASVLRAGWEKYWQRSPETILGEMEAELEETITILQLVMQAGESVNTWLAALDDDRFSIRAPEALPEGWTFDGTDFTFTPPEPESEPE